MTQARVGWLVALVTVPAFLAALALLWVQAPAPAAPSVVASSAPPTSAAPAVPPGAAGETGPASVVPEAVPAELAGILATHPIRFGADSAELTGPPADTVQRVAQLLVSVPAARVLVEGHVADTPGGPDAVQRLSDQRAAVVAQALVAAGVPAGRITTRGLGATRPLATVEESRRVEITVG